MFVSECRPDRSRCMVRARIIRDQTARNSIPQSPGLTLAGPLRIGSAHFCCRASVGVEAQIYQRRCAPFCPMFAKGHQTGGRPAITPEPSHRGAREGGAIIARTGDHRNRHQSGDPSPIFPAHELRQIVRPHQPHKVAFGPAQDELAKRIDRETRAQFALNRADPDWGPAGLSARRSETLGERRHACSRFQRISRRHQPPHFIERKSITGKQRNSPVPAMRRVETAAQKADPGGVQGRTWPEPRTCHL